MTWFAPMRSRILPCDREIAFAQICWIPRSTRFAVMSTLASMEEPTATTAIPNSRAPSWRRASMLRASACTACVTRSDHFCTSAESASTAKTSRSRRSSCPAVAAPNRPRPITRTGALCGMRSTNDRPLLGSGEQLPALAGREGRGEGHRADAAHEHRRTHHVLARIVERCGEAGAEAGGAERGDHVEEHAVERGGRELQQDDRRRCDGGRPPEHDGDREAQHVARDLPLEGLHRRVAPGLRESCEEQHREGRDLDAACGGGRPAADQ